MQTRPWIRAAVAMFAVAWGANQFTSLLLAYRAEDGLSATQTDALFGVYAVGLIPTLLIVGPVSDRLGRRRTARLALAGSVLATVVLMLGDLSDWFLYPGRFLAGVASGAVFAPGTAWVKELSSPPHAPPGTESAGARRAAVALSAGFSLGPLTAGLVAQWSPAPLVTAYLPHLLVCAVAVGLAWNAPETVGAVVPDARPAGLRAAADPRFARVVAPLAPWVFIAAAISLTVGPALVADRVGGFPVAFAGLVAGLTLGTGVLVQPLARRLDTPDGRSAMTAGLAVIVAAALVQLLTAVTGQPALAVLAAVLFGAGYGFSLVGGLTATQRIAGPHDLAALTAVFYALTYVGFAAPLILTEALRLASYPQLLLLVAGLAAVTLLAVRHAARRLPPDGTVGGRS